jgi:4-hydroxymandelate oxidase
LNTKFQEGGVHAKLIRKNEQLAQISAAARWEYRPAIECLPEVLDGAAGKITVIVDGGIRRGTDAFKALALGAAAVGIGRPYIWGLGAFGQPGVEAVLEILRRELQTIMRQTGSTSIAGISRAQVMERPR